jgi:hypothetical protein
MEKDELYCHNVLFVDVRVSAYPCLNIFYYRAFFYHLTHIGASY